LSKAAAGHDTPENTDYLTLQCEELVGLGLIADYLVAERTRIQNRLRWHLLELCDDLEQTLRRCALDRPRELDRVDRRLRKLPTGARVRVACNQIAQLRDRRPREYRGPRPVSTPFGPAWTSNLVSTATGIDRFVTKWGGSNRGRTGVSDPAPQELSR
jgi:hypothetical protein